MTSVSSQLESTALPKGELHEEGALILSNHGVCQLLSLFQAEQPAAVFRLPGYRRWLTPRGRLHSVTSGRVAWELTGTSRDLPTEALIPMHELMYLVPISNAELRGTRLTADVPRWIERTESAWHRPVRSRLAIGLLAPAGAVVRPVRRLSGAGAAIALEKEEADRFSLSSPTVEVVLESGQTMKAYARQRETFPDPESGDTLCPIELRWPASGDRLRWEAEVERHVSPHTRSQGTWAASLWELYDRSGYFNLSGKTTAHFAHMRADFAIASRRLDLAPQVGRQIAWISQRGAEAALSLARLYSHTSMIYQVARRRDEPCPASARQMLRDINLHAVDRLRRDPDPSWVLVYVQEGGARWSNLAYQVFSEIHVESGSACLVPFRAMEGNARPSLRETGGYQVAPATPDERRLLLAVVRRARPAAYLDALDLTSEHLDLAEVQSEWRRAGFDRARDILVAHHQSRPVAAVVLEVAQDAMHLFRLFDSLRLFPLAAEGDRAFPALLEAAHGWYHARGKERFTCLFETESLPFAESCGLRDLGTAQLMAFSSDLFPDFIEHLHLITAARPASRAEGHA